MRVSVEKRSGGGRGAGGQGDRVRGKDKDAGRGQISPASEVKGLDFLLIARGKYDHL